MNYRSSLSQVQGLGSAKSGVAHWWLQRLTAVALIPLSAWFGVMLVCVCAGGYRAAVGWLASPLQVALMIAFVSTLLYHAHLGMQVIIEDYIHGEGVKIATLIAVRLTLVLCALTSIVSILSISFGD